MKGKPMLRFLKDTNGVLDVTLSHIGLFIATAILLTVVLSFVFSNEWQRTDELQSIASSFSNLLMDVDSTFFENTTLFQFPEKGYPYTVTLSTEYIRISAKGAWGTDLVMTNKFVIRPWPRYTYENWTTGDDLHAYLNKTYGHHGTKNDSISSVNLTNLYNEQNMTILYSALHPLEIVNRTQVYVEKVTIFYDEEKIHDFLLVYQA